MGYQKHFCWSSLIFSLILSNVCGFPIPNYQPDFLSKRSNTPILLTFDIVRKASRTNSQTIGIQNKNFRNATADDLLIDLKNEYSTYMVDISLGGQNLRVSLDTGSSDLWVPGKISGQSQYYNEAISKSYKYYKPDFIVVYSDDININGYWGKDSMTMGNITIDDMIFGVANSTNSGEGVFGIGFSQNEVSAILLKAVENGDLQESSSDGENSKGFYYDNYPLLLKKQGYINKLAYSLYLNSAASEQGSILFGGIDKAKFEGDKLSMLDLVNVKSGLYESTNVSSFHVELKQFSTSNNFENNFTVLSSTSYPALLDSGTSLIYAPPSIAESLQLKYGTYDPRLQRFSIDCDLKGADFTFHFDKNAKITVPLEDLVFKDTATNRCILGIVKNNDDSWILGDVFLRSAYLLYDLENRQIGISQAKYTTESEIIIL